MQDQIEVTEKSCQKLAFQTAFVVEGQEMQLQKDVVPADADLIRLILQWAFEVANVDCLRVPTGPPEHYLLWVSAGARIEGAFFRISNSDFASANRSLGCKGASWLELEQPALHVAAIALISDKNEILLSQRPRGKSFEGLWEFPGGKIESGESPELALCREIHEELGIDIWNSCLSPLTFASHAYEGFHLTMLAFACYRFEGEPTPKEGQELRWWPPQDLDANLMPPANAPLIYAVQDLLT